MNARFKRLIKPAMKWEGSRYTDHPADKGGATRWGITQKFLSEHWKRSASKADVRNLTREASEAIYYHERWVKLQLDDVRDDGVALFLLDASINHGPGRARKFARTVLNQPKYNANSLNFDNAHFLVHKLTEIRRDFYHGIVERKPSQKVFIKGWINRLNDIHSICVKLAGEPMQNYDNRWLQKSLNKLGFNVGEVDGIVGPKTNAAIVEFKRSVGLRARPYVGPKTLEALAKAVKRKVPKAPQINQYSQVEEPWMQEISKFMSLHEVRDNAELSRWLKSDGKTLGDPAKLPWCGDAAITALVKTLPRERLPKSLEANPYWARNFAKFGKSAGKGCYGAVLVFSRGKGGHVGFAVGYDPVKNRYRVRGGNQGDMIKDSWIDGKRLLAARMPSSWKRKPRPLPIMNSRGAVISRNEA